MNASTDVFGEVRMQPYATLTDVQQQFLADPATYKMMGGASGGGKSFGFRAEAFRSSSIVPRAKGLVLRRSRPEVQKNFVEPMLEETRYKDLDGTEKPFVRYVESKNVMHFPNGSKIDIGYCENRRDVERYRGLEYDWLGIEELTQWEEEMFLMACTVLRSTKTGIRPFFMGTCNPGGVGHGWVKRRWISRNFEKGERPEDFGMTRAYLSDNPFMGKEYRHMLEALPEKERRARLFGDWDVFDGQYFNEYRESLHVVEPCYPLGLVRRIIAIDYGYRAPCAVLWMGLDTQGHLWIYREYSCTGKSYAELAATINALTNEGEKISCIVVDPAAIDNETADTKTTLRKEFRKAGLPHVVPGKNSRVEGWRAVRTYLQAHRNPNTGEWYSTMHIGRNCKKLIETFPDQVHDERDPEDMNSKGADHWLDAARYGIMELGVSITSFSDVMDLNAILDKGAARRDMSQKDRELLDRGISDGSQSILRQEF